MTSAVNSYHRDMKRLKSVSPEWKPVSLKKYVEEFQKKTLR